ncbi:hypothetical protein F511_29301 [Dorcoceras hygrometricum]|uniref:Uncharacterized protein n=1 Tax=Dorcoceras hygrometricum TaxID=472368 RepID=A0A2Z7CMQ6_9LAMI|nr:hypothetical protein F511_29301 [Dorcoceras hygrometricum]
MLRLLAAGIARKSYRLDDVSGATSFELVATLRFEVATGTSREKCCACFVLATEYPAAGSKDCVSYETSFGFSGEFPSIPVVVLLVRGDVGLLLRSSFILYQLQRLVFVGERSRNYCSRPCSPYWGLTPCPSGALFVSLFVLFSGNPGFTAGRGLNPAGGAPGGG